MNMKRLFAALLTVLSLSFMSDAAKKECILNSPDSGISVKISTVDGVAYSVDYNGQEILAPSRISMTLEDGRVFGQGKIRKIRSGSVENRGIRTIVYKKEYVDDVYNFLAIDFKDCTLEFRAYDDAVAYAKENGLDYDYNYSAAMTCNWYYTVQGKFAEGFMDLQTYQVYSENYLGGAHGMHYLIPDIINLKTGEIVTENELFKPGYVAPVTELIKSKLALDRGVEDINESVMFSEGLVPNGHCGVSGAGVTWYYQPYEIASYAEGIIEVTVFWIDLKPYLNPEFVKF